MFLVRNKRNRASNLLQGPSFIPEFMARIAIYHYFRFPGDQSPNQGLSGAHWVNVHYGGLDDSHVFGSIALSSLGSALTVCLLPAPE